ncbi:hypothetical protein G5714_021038 [Onychostoma macrolepis]|uniref:AIG1-type G domain-containing protein n=1 Tax=Onychostoma macrolepis TaxID=369639 RepID=A0A7J6BVL3_9TELE|nr:hypothetical protein G5714_021038 [Onychostoma macrolepis]
MDSVVSFEAREFERQSKRRHSMSDEHPNILCFPVCDLRIVLLGKNFAENSRVRNLIMEIDMCENEEPAALQRLNLMVSGMVKDRHVTVINTLRLLNLNISDHQITQRVSDCVDMSDPGPHAFILVLQYNDFTEEDMRRVKYVLNKFSKKAIKHTIVITTDKEIPRSMFSSLMSHTEQLFGGSALVQTIHQLIKECGGGHLPLDERKTELHSDIFKRIDKILKGNQKAYLTCDIFHNPIETSVDEEPISSEENNKKSSHLSDEGKHKERPEGRSDEGHLFYDTRSQSPKSIRPNMSAIFSGKKQKLNLVLCGSDGSLKVSVSKLLRGKKIKPSCRQASSEVREKKEEKIHGRLISLLEFPALDQLSEEEVMRQTLRCVSLCHPGVHAFIIIIPVGPLTDEDKTEIEKIKRIFDSCEQVILLFTTNLTVEASVTDFVKSSSECQRLISLCGGQYRVIGLKESKTQDRSQIYWII